MKKISEQKVVVLCDFSGAMNGTILHGICLAAFLKKELCLLSFVVPGENKLAMHDRLRERARLVKQETGGMEVSTLVLKGVLEYNAKRLVDKYDAIILVLNKQKLPGKLRALQESPIPYLFVAGTDQDLRSYKKVLLPVDLRKKMKETSLWASYLGRFNQSIVHILGAGKTQAENLQAVKKNLLFIHKFLSDLNVPNIVEEGKSGIWRVQFEALRKAKNGQCDVLIILGSKNISPLDLLVGLPEKKIIKRSGEIPVICVNPTKDMNVLCD